MKNEYEEHKFSKLTVDELTVKNLVTINTPREFEKGPIHLIAEESFRNSEGSISAEASTGRLKLMPFTQYKTITFDRMALRLGTADGGQDAEIAIYEINKAKDGMCKVFGVPFDPDGDTTKLLSFPKFTLDIGRYWIGSTTNSPTASITTFALSINILQTGWTTLAPHTNFIGWQINGQNGVAAQEYLFSALSTFPAVQAPACWVWDSDNDLDITNTEFRGE